MIKDNKSTKTVQVIGVLLMLLVSCHTGPLAAGVWSTLCSSCMAGCVTTGPGYAACVAACCAAGPIATWWACFDEDTTVLAQTGNMLLKDLKVGDQIKTISHEGHEKWTRVVLIEQTEGKHFFVTIKTETKKISVTDDHVMISNFKLVKAKDLKIGDLINGEPIKELTYYEKQKKTTVITQEGTLLANGVLTTVICGTYIDKHGSSYELIEQWKNDHAWLMGKSTIQI